MRPQGRFSLEIPPLARHFPQRQAVCIEPAELAAVRLPESPLARSDSEQRQARVDIDCRNNVGRERPVRPHKLASADVEERDLAVLAA